MLKRRQLLTAGIILAGIVPLRAQAQVVERATAFVQQTGERLTAIVNGTQPATEKRRALTQILDAAVDVDGVARFCLGRFWRAASPQQQQSYLAAFREVLVTNITAKLGDYRGVRLTVQRSRQQDDDVIVTSVVERPNNPPTTVDWVIGRASANPKIIDVVAEGTSLRLTQRQDYASFLTRNNNDINALISAMRQQLTQNG